MTDRPRSTPATTQRTHSPIRTRYAERVLLHIPRNDSWACLMGPRYTVPYPMEPAIGYHGKPQRLFNFVGCSMESTSAMTLGRSIGNSMACPMGCLEVNNVIQTYLVIIHGKHHKARFCRGGIPWCTVTHATGLYGSTPRVPHGVSN